MLRAPSRQLGFQVSDARLQVLKEAVGGMVCYDYPLVNYIAMDNNPFIVDSHKKLVISHSYVSLQEGNGIPILSHRYAMIIP